jgi:hypothetical protein
MRKKPLARNAKVHAAMRSRFSGADIDRALPARDVVQVEVHRAQPHDLGHGCAPPAGGTSGSAARCELTTTSASKPARFSPIGRLTDGE